MTSRPSAPSVPFVTPICACPRMFPSSVSMTSMSLPITTPGLPPSASRSVTWVKPRLAFFCNGFRASRTIPNNSRLLPSSSSAKRRRPRTRSSRGNETDLGSNVKCLNGPKREFQFALSRILFCSLMSAEELPIKIANSPGSKLQSCFLTSKKENARLLSARTTCFVSPGRS